jgi:hypothetical protein
MACIREECASVQHDFSSAFGLPAMVVQSHLKMKYLHVTEI